mgnify:CR=1 FL=1
MSEEANGRLRLTFAQATWCVMVLVVLIGGWYRIEFRLNGLEEVVRNGIYSKSEIDDMKRQADRVHDELRLEIKERSSHGP